MLSVTFPGHPQDESSYARDVINSTASKGFFLTPNPDNSISYLEEVVYSIEDICGLGLDPWILYKTMKENGISVSLDGHGGDELLAGYNHYPNVMMKDWHRLSKSRPSIRKLNEIYQDMTPEGNQISQFRQRLGNRPRESILRKHRLLKQNPTPFISTDTPRQIPSRKERASFPIIIFRFSFWKFTNNSSEF